MARLLARLGDYASKESHRFQQFIAFMRVYLRPFWLKEESALPTLVTQFSDFDECRFIPDNFGAALEPETYPNPVSNLYDTFCFTAKDVDKHTSIGTAKTTSHR